MACSKPHGYKCAPDPSNLWSRVAVTDIGFFWGRDFPAQTLSEYERQTRSNLRQLFELGAFVQEEWNLFNAGPLWRRHFTSAPDIILLSGTWNNPTADGKLFETAGGEDINGQEFLEHAVVALLATWPDATVMVLQAPHHLPQGGMNSCCFWVKSSLGITMAFPPDALPIKDTIERGIGVMVTGSRLRRVYDFVGYEEDPCLPGTVRECMDLFAFLHAALHADQHVLQLGCNRAQLMVAFEQYLRGSPVPRAFPSVPAPRMPPPQRMHWEADAWLIFTYEDLVAAWGGCVPPENLVRYWLDSYPLAEGRDCAGRRIYMENWVSAAPVMQGATEAQFPRAESTGREVQEEVEVEEVLVE